MHDLFIFFGLKWKLLMGIQAETQHLEKGCYFYNHFYFHFCFKLVTMHMCMSLDNFWFFVVTFEPMISLFLLLRKQTCY
jgi:hypothetical protein